MNADTRSNEAQRKRRNDDADDFETASKKLITNDKFNESKKRRQSKRRRNRNRITLIKNKIDQFEVFNAIKNGDINRLDFFV